MMALLSRRNITDDVEGVTTRQKESVDRPCLRKKEGICLDIASCDDDHANCLTVTVDAGAWVLVTAGGEGSPLFSV
jgi:hypothetical protein